MKDKKNIITLAIGIGLLAILVIGATYAFFAVTSNNEFGTKYLSADLEEMGTVTLTKIQESLTLNVTKEQMDPDNIGTDYYASGSATPANIGVAHVEGVGTFNCSYSLQITKSSNGNDTYELFQSGNYTDKGSDQILLNINDTTYDFNTSSLFPISHTGTISNLSSSSDQYITANMIIKNTDADQTYLNNSDLTLTFNVTKFECEVVDSNNAPA